MFHAPKMYFVGSTCYCNVLRGAMFPFAVRLYTVMESLPRFVTNISLFAVSTAIPAGADKFVAEPPPLGGGVVPLSPPPPPPPQAPVMAMVSERSSNKNTL